MPWELPRDLDTPALVVDIDVLEANVASMASHATARSVVLRPHAKTHKCVEIARRQIGAGAVGLTVATIGEAEVFAAAGFDDLFVAYPLVASGPKAARLRTLAERAQLRVGVDSREAAALIGRALGTGSQLEILVELDSGHHRTGVARHDAPSVAHACAAAGMDVVGVFTHPGHAYAGPGAVDGAAADEARTLAEGAAELAAAGFDVRVLSGGSTPTVWAPPVGGTGPTAPASHAGPQVDRAPTHEQRPGSYVFNDRIQCALGAAPPEQVALVVAATVVSTAAPGQFVIDAGSKALSPETVGFLDGCGEVLAPGGSPGTGAVLARLSEHHGIAVAPGRRPAVGDLVAVVPNHVCPVVDHFDHYVVVRDGAVVGRWPVDARGRLT